MTEDADSSLRPSCVKPSCGQTGRLGEGAPPRLQETESTQIKACGGRAWSPTWVKTHADKRVKWDVDSWLGELGIGFMALRSRAAALNHHLAGAGCPLHPCGIPEAGRWPTSRAMPEKPSPAW